MGMLCRNRDLSPPRTNDVFVNDIAEKSKTGCVSAVNREQMDPDQKLRNLRALWNSVRGSRTMPSRAEFTARLLKPWLGNLALLELASDGEAVFRLCGTNLYSRFGGEVSGLSVQSLDSRIRQSLLDCIASVCQKKEPCEAAHSREINGHHIVYREMCLPLSVDAVHVEGVLLVSFKIGEESIT